jgi:hypothetical protein
MDEKLVREVEQFLYREARWLDERRFHEWLELLTEDIRYWMPVRTSRYPKLVHMRLVHSCGDLVFIYGNFLDCSGDCRLIVEL